MRRLADWREILSVAESTAAEKHEASITEVYWDEKQNNSDDVMEFALVKCPIAILVILCENTIKFISYCDFFLQYSKKNTEIFYSDLTTQM